MTDADAEQYLTPLVKIEGMSTAELTLHIKRSIKLGVKDFWTAGNWYFNTDTVTLATTANTQTTSLPELYDSVISIRETDSLEGSQLDYIPKERFDYLYPSIVNEIADVPQLYTIYYDKSEARFKIQWYPCPDTTYSLSALLRAVPPENMSVVPEKFASCCLAGIAKYCYPIGSAQRVAAIQEYEIELRNARRKNMLQTERPVHTVGGFGEFHPDTRRPWVK